VAIPRELNTGKAELIMQHQCFTVDAFTTNDPVDAARREFHP
jgi:hypothetical protein